MLYISLKWIACENLCIVFDKNKMVDLEKTFWACFSSNSTGYILYTIF